MCRGVCLFETRSSWCWNANDGQLLTAGGSILLDVSQLSVFSPIRLSVSVRCREIDKASYSCLPSAFRQQFGRQLQGNVPSSTWQPIPFKEQLHVCGKQKSPQLQPQFSRDSRISLARFSSVFFHDLTPARRSSFLRFSDVSVSMSPALASFSSFESSSSSSPPTLSSDKAFCSE